MMLRVRPCFMFRQAFEFHRPPLIFEPCNKAYYCPQGYNPHIKGMPRQASVPTPILMFRFIYHSSHVLRYVMMGSKAASRRIFSKCRPQTQLLPCCRPPGNLRTPPLKGFTLHNWLSKMQCAKNSCRKSDLNFFEWDDACMAMNLWFTQVSSHIDRKNIKKLKKFNLLFQIWNYYISHDRQSGNVYCFPTSASKRS